jgi:hypothetical protein
MLLTDFFRCIYTVVRTQAYHCRLRRKHKELDYDGGDSPAIIAPLFDAPMDSLLRTTSS